MTFLQICIRMMISAVLLVSSSAALAQAYPTKPIKIITSVPSGAPGITARILVPELAGLGQPIVLDARPAGVTIGMAAAKAPADGYNLLLINGAIWIVPLLYKEPPYEMLRDFAPITMIARAANLVVVHASLPARSLKELIALAKASPGKLNFSSGTNGSSSHLGIELLKSMAGIDMTRVAYKDPARESADLLAGVIHLTFGNGPSMSGPLQTGKVRALAVTSARPSVFFPDLPTVAETLPGYVSETQLGLFAPAGTPAAIIARLNREFTVALAKKEVVDALAKNGLEPAGGTPEQFRDTVAAEISRLGALIKTLGITVD